MATEEFGLTAEYPQATEALVLSESNFNADPSQIVLEASDRDQLKFNLIQWLAESPNRGIKSQRKQAVADTLGVSVRQVERLLKQYDADELIETVGVERSEPGCFIHKWKPSTQLEKVSTTVVSQGRSGSKIHPT